ncbi:TPA: hypothetical protein KQG29_001544 [Clostridioides difficile]|nr:hypothetical protein [Clostridioides difficile]
MNKKSNCKLIILEGEDSIFKSNQMYILKDILLLKGYNVKVLEFPEYNFNFLLDIYNDINIENLKNILPHVFKIDNYYKYIKICNDSYQNKTIIITNKSMSTDIYFNYLKRLNNINKDNFMSWIKKIESNLFKLPKADKIIFLDEHYKQFPVEYEIYKKFVLNETKCSYLNCNISTKDEFISISNEIYKKIKKIL